jgi:hypothetical protein
MSEDLTRTNAQRELGRKLAGTIGKRLAAIAVRVARRKAREKPKAPSEDSA